MPVTVPYTNRLGVLAKELGDISLTGLVSRPLEEQRERRLSERLRPYKEKLLEQGTRAGEQAIELGSLNIAREKDLAERLKIADIGKQIEVEEESTRLSREKLLGYELSGIIENDEALENSGIGKLAKSEIEAGDVAKAGELIENWYSKRDVARLKPKPFQRATIEQSKLEEIDKAIRSDYLIGRQLSALGAANDVIVMLRSNNPIAVNSIGVKMARLATEVGNLAIQEQETWKTSRAVVDRGLQYIKTLKSGNLTENNIKYLREVAEGFSSTANKIYKGRVKTIATIKKKIYNLDENMVNEIVRLYEDPFSGYGEKFSEDRDVDEIFKAVKSERNGKR